MAIGTITAASIGGMAALGAIGGALKKGPNIQQSALSAQAQEDSLNALNAYRNLAAVGPGASDVSAATNTSRQYAQTLGNFAQNGLYNQQQGNLLAEQQFAGQRTALEQTFQDQLQSANRQAAISGRGANDPILRARLAVEQSRQSSLLNANQSSAAMNLGRQFSLDQIAVGGQQVNTLNSLANQAYANQQNLFQMGQTALAGERNYALQSAGYEAQRGGGLLGGLTGAISGASAGLNMAGGISSLIGGQQLRTAQIDNLNAQTGVLQSAPQSVGAGSSYALGQAAQPFQQYASAIGPQIPQGYIQTGQGWQLPTTQASTFVAAPRWSAPPGFNSFSGK